MFGACALILVNMWPSLRTKNKVNEDEKKNKKKSEKEQDEEEEIQNDYKRRKSLQLTFNLNANNAFGQNMFLCSLHLFIFISLCLK